MDAISPDLEDYARRRLKLAGYSIIGYDHPYFVPLDRLQSELNARGEVLTSFANYDYLGLGQDPRVKAAACRAVNDLGIGATGSRLVGGERSSHRALEYDLATFIGVDDTLTMVSGYGTDVSIVGHLLGKGDLILVDELAHNSINVGTKLSRATVVAFSHNDTDELASILQKRRNQFRRVLIILEGLYSMDGDLPDLPRILELRDRYKAWVMIDEAHSIGVLGKSGRGITEHYGIDPSEIDLIVGTLSKAFVSCGGFIGGKQIVIDWLRFTLPGFVYSVGLSPAIVGAVREAIDVVRQEPERVSKLRKNARHFLAQARALGFNVGEAVGEGLIPILFESPERAMWAARTLMRGGYYVPPIVHVGIPKNKPRLRFFLSAAHTFEQIDGVLDMLDSALRPGAHRVYNEPERERAGAETARDTAPRRAPEDNNVFRLVSNV